MPAVVAKKKHQLSLLVLQLQHHVPAAVDIPQQQPSSLRYLLFKPPARRQGKWSQQPLSLLQAAPVPSAQVRQVAMQACRSVMNLTHQAVRMGTVKMGMWIEM
jgi:hypothetical protein